MQCKHKSYKNHETFLGGFCKGNPDRWYPILFMVLATGILSFIAGVIALVIWAV